MTRFPASLLVFAVLTGCSNGPTEPAPVPSTLPIPPGAGLEAAEMFRRLEEFIAQSVAFNQELLPLNPRWASFLDRKIALLKRPGLALDMSANSQFVQTDMRSISGATVRAALLFPAEEMRSDGHAVLSRLDRVMPLLEGFIARAYPHDYLRVWYGFTLGSRGGGGTIEIEDRAGYIQRVPNELPHDAIVGHELTHSFLSSEALTQFVELYLYNVLETGSPAVKDWTFTRGYVPFAAGNMNSAALLDVYQLIGESAMSAAYHEAQPLGARYGEPLPAAVQAAFIKRAPANSQEQVRDLLTRVVF
jgi:hypothetical protein